MIFIHSRPPMNAQDYHADFARVSNRFLLFFGRAGRVFLFVLRVFAFILFVCLRCIKFHLRLAKSPYSLFKAKDFCLACNYKATSIRHTRTDKSAGFHPCVFLGLVWATPRIINRRCSSFGRVSAVKMPMRLNKSCVRCFCLFHLICCKCKTII